MAEQQQVDPNQLLQAMQMQVAAQVGEMLQKKVRFYIIFVFVFFEKFLLIKKLYCC